MSDVEPAAITLTVHAEGTVINPPDPDPEPEPEPDDDTGEDD
jgi:hypothetical protein